MSAAASGFPTLLRKEVARFWKVSFQTVAAPVLTTLLYLLVFAHALAAHVQVFPGVSYVQFLIPGLAMMAVLQNAFANSSSSIIQSKITGNMIFILLPPLSAGEIFAAYLLASMVRGLVVGAVKAAPGSCAFGRNSPRIRRCALEEIGRNSVRPCTRQRMIASSTLGICLPPALAECRESSSVSCRGQ